MVTVLSHRLRVPFLFFFAYVLAGPSPAQVTIIVSVDPNGAPANGFSTAPSISADGRFVTFDSNATNFVPGTLGWEGVFLRDRQLGMFELVSQGPGGVQASGQSGYGAVSADGRCVAFASEASNLVPRDANGLYDAFVRDRESGTTELVSVDSNGVQSNAVTFGFFALSADGRFVAFTSYASNLVPGDSNGETDVFVRDRTLGTTERVSVADDGSEGNVAAFQESMSADGRYVAFWSSSSNLVPGDTNGLSDIFVRDRLAGTTERVSVASSGAQGNGACGYFNAISADGRYVSFESLSTNLVRGDTNGVSDIFVRDRQQGTTERVSVGSLGEQANGDSTWPSISADGRCVLFESEATNLVPGDTNGFSDVFLRDRLTGHTERSNVAWNSIQASFNTGYSRISADGRFVAFASSAPNLVPADPNHTTDVFLRDRFHPPFASLCEPGASGVAGCPCANPPSGPERGCDNSAATGGAKLVVRGNESFSSDTIVFSTEGQTISGTSLVVQGDGFRSSGGIYGQGVRCVVGSLKRLYTRVAVGGGIAAPNLYVGEPTVHARSAELGAPIPAGSTRYYFVVYRDPIVLGGCPGTSTFNCTQARAIVWQP